MKKRNKYWERDKEYIRLLDALEKNRTAQRNLGYVELEEPIPHGFNAYFVLRDDIANRDDAWILQRIIDSCSHSAWRKKNTFQTVKARRERHGDHNAKNCRFDQYPNFHNITEAQYNAFTIEAKKWFSSSEDKWGRSYYYVNVPIFYFEVKIERDYRTKVKIIDNVLLQEEAEIEAKLYGYSDRRWIFNSGGVPRSFTRAYTVSHRREEKRLLHAMIYKGKEDLCFPGNHRHSARWDYW